MRDKQNISSNNRRIAKNTMALYVRMFITMGISLYTSRIVLQSLGVSDFGIYNVVGGVVSMISCLNGSFNSSTSRFITFELGKKNGNVQAVFSSAMLNFSLCFSFFCHNNTYFYGSNYVLNC